MTQPVPTAGPGGASAVSQGDKTHDGVFRQH